MRFVLATFIYSLVIPWPLDDRNKLEILAFAAIAAGFLLILFTYFLSIRLPIGIIYGTLCVRTLWHAL